MAKQDKNKLRGWFSTSKFPTQEQFWDWMDSFVHKDERLDIASNFPELDHVLQLKADKEALDCHFKDDENPHKVTKQQVGLGNVDNTADIDKAISTAAQNALDLKAEKEVVGNHVKDNTNPHKVTKQQVGLGNADDTADWDKPISRETYAALYLKEDKETFNNHVQNYENPHRVSKLQVGLGNVDDTSDVDKPVSTATQSALDLKADKDHIHAASTLTGFDTDVTLAASSDEKVSSQKAVKTYVDTVTEALQTRVFKLEKAQPIPGMIIAWKGSTSAIPAGWQLCQELKDKFILGAGDDFQVGATGGARTHDLKIEEMPAHQHSISTALVLNTSSALGVFNGGDSSKSELSSAKTDAIGGSQPHNNMPPYYALAYIEYVG